MLRTALLAICCVSAISASEAQQVSPPGALPAGQRLRNNAVAQPEDFSSPEARAKQVWRQNMAKKSARQPGCFTATFPSTEWKETTCSTAPARPHPIRLGPGPHAGGKGKSPVAQLNSSQIFAATGMLATVSGVTSETDTKAGANTWSLQLNTNAFDPGTLCAGQAGCIGWEQFVADTPGDVYIQYWLVNHNSPCPARPAGFPDDWSYSKGDADEGAASGCYINGRQTPVTRQALDKLQGLRVTGTSSSTAQSVTLETADNHMFTAKDAGDPLSIGTQWKTAEFNIFGLQDNSVAQFNPGGSIVVRVDVDYAGEAAPDCSVGGSLTAESNSLTPFAPCAGYPGQANISDPGIQFTEDSIPAITGCLYSNGTATCVPIPGSNFSDAIYQANCPAGATMQLMSGGLWQANLPLHCSDGKLPGSCGPGATVAGEPVFSTQRYGSVWSGAAIGSAQTVGVCDSASQCSRFTLTIPSCPSVVAAGDSFRLSEGNNPIDVEAGSSIDANLILDGPWVSADHGVNAVAQAFDTGGLPYGVTPQFSPGVSGAPHSYGLININLSAPANAPPGDYQFQAKAIDAASNLSLTTVVPVKVLACVPKGICSTSVSHFCGRISDGCGGSTDCGSCATGVCSNSVCCPNGSFYNTEIQTCQLNSCPAGTEFCPADAKCETYDACNKLSPPDCRKIGGRIVCQ